MTGKYVKGFLNIQAGDFTILSDIQFECHVDIRTDSNGFAYVDDVSEVALIGFDTDGNGRVDLPVDVDDTVLAVLRQRILDYCEDPYGLICTLDLND